MGRRFLRSSKVAGTVGRTNSMNFMALLFPPHSHCRAQMAMGVSLKTRSKSDHTIIMHIICCDKSPLPSLTKEGGGILPATAHAVVPRCCGSILVNQKLPPMREDPERRGSSHEGGGWLANFMS